MAVHSFSTKPSRPGEEEVVQSIKAYCDKHKVVFSGIVITALAKWREEDERFRLSNNR